MTETPTGPSAVAANVRISTSVTAERLDAAAALTAVADPGAGGTCVFAGTVRDHADGRSVEGLEYEVWQERAEAVLAEVARDVVAAHPELRAVYAAHRSGALAVGDVSVVVAASAAHRAEAFEGARALIDEVKQRLPIWKRERFADGAARWVGDPAESPQRTA